MRKEDIDGNLQAAAFDFFYWFSRFEYALKANRYLKSETLGADAEPSWNLLKSRHHNEYVSSDEAKKLLELHPQRQVIAAGGELRWRPVGTAHCNNDLCRVIAMILTVRNNLFHGGKEGVKELDDKLRNLELLTVGKVVLDQLAVLARFDSDYSRQY